jgi:DNA-binding NarL/FixJ family response regulator
MSEPHGVPGVTIAGATSTGQRALVVEPVSPGDEVVSVWIADPDDGPSVLLDTARLDVLIADLTQRRAFLGQVRRVAPIADLSTRERLVLVRMSNGQTDKEIAAGMELSSGTIGQVVAGLYRKLGVSSRPHAVRLGFEQGWLA